MGSNAQVTNPALNLVINERRAMSPAYAAAELLWYVSGSDRVAPLLPYAPQYAAFAEPDGTAHGAYGHRLATNISGINQLELVVEALRRRPESRQTVASMWRPTDLNHAVLLDKKDVPCTLNWQFMVRDKQLHMIVTMRSQDVWLGMPYDAFVNTCMMRLIANELGVQLGTYTHNCGSLHLYEKHEVAAREAMALSNHECEHGWTLDDNMYSAQKACAWESAMRLGETRSHEPLGSMTRDLVATCAVHLNKIDVESIYSPALRQGVKHYADRRRD